MAFPDADRFCLILDEGWDPLRCARDYGVTPIRTRVVRGKFSAISRCGSDARRKPMSGPVRLRTAAADRVGIKRVIASSPLSKGEGRER
jgi:hypothetical protein